MHRGRALYENGSSVPGTGHRLISGVSLVFVQDIFGYYQLPVEQLFFLHTYRAFTSYGRTFLVVPLADHQHGAVNELANLAFYMRQAGENGIVLPVVNQYGRLESRIDGKEVVVYRCPPVFRKRPRPLGKELANFHARSAEFRFAASEHVHFGRWDEFWGGRMDQLEKWRDDISGKNKKDRFDKAFLSSFPYYLGLAENAIQYAVDAGIERNSYETATICHHRFNKYSWYYDGEAPLKIPSEWVIDHPSRDLAEWIRFSVWTQGTQREDITHFLKDYESERELTLTGRRLLYARLLFPLIYVETVEGYYRAQSENMRWAYWQQLQELIERTDEYENFLRGFRRSEDENLPGLDWLY